MSIRLGVKGRVRHLVFSSNVEKIKRPPFIKLSFEGESHCENVTVLHWDCHPEELSNSSCYVGHTLLPSSALCSEMSEMKVILHLTLHKANVPN